MTLAARTTTSWTIPGSPVTVDIVHAGLACCALEIQAAQQRGDLVRANGGAVEDASTGANGVRVLVVAGTLTRALIPGVIAAFHASQPSVVMAFGACATSGGPYWDAPNVIPGIDQAFLDAGITVPLVTYVPGCPPDPRAFIEALKGCVP